MCIDKTNPVTLSPPLQCCEQRQNNFYVIYNDTMRYKLNIELGERWLKS